MPASYQAISALNLLHVKFSGNCKTSETDALVDFYAVDPRVVAGMRCLVDCSEVLSFRINAEERKNQMELLKLTLAPVGRVWTVVYYCPTEVSLNVAKMHLLLWESHSDVNLVICEDPVEAARALGISKLACQEFFSQTPKSFPAKGFPNEECFTTYLVFANGRTDIVVMGKLPEQGQGLKGQVVCGVEQFIPARDGYDARIWLKPSI
ncbi:hypothetical protein [Thalassobius sp. MITS945101]|uniref:hypothetical protein n=1 Tax=Thalassobius sp. MITS945101 TaxID=3096994 RepID=UPI00399C4551